MSSTDTSFNEKECKELKQLLKDRLTEKFDRNKNPNPMFWNADEFVKRLGKFVQMSNKQPADVISFMVSQGGTTKLPSDNNLGSLALNNKNNNVRHV